LIVSTHVVYRVAQKFGTIILYALTLPSINRFSKLFHYQNQEKIYNNIIIKIPPHLKCVAAIPCEMSSLKSKKLKTRRLL